MKHLKSKRRGVSVVISTLLVLAITVVGALFISDLVSSSALTTVTQAPKSIVAANSLEIISYDTRDGGTLAIIPTLNNKPGDGLCTIACAGPNVDRTPANDGTDFIIFKIWNKNVNKIIVSSIQVNGILHSWDRLTRNVDFNGGDEITTGAYPDAGKFSIFKSNDPDMEQKSQDVEGDEEVWIVVKLSPTIQGDLPTGNLELGKPLQILLNMGDNQPSEYIILSGDTK